MLDEAGQREARRRHGYDGGLLIVLALALDGEGGAVKSPGTVQPSLPVADGKARPTYRLLDGIIDISVNPQDAQGRRNWKTRKSSCRK